MTLATEVADYLRGANMRRARAELVADEFCLSISAFNHRLRACCTSFSDLKDREMLRRLEGRVMATLISPAGERVEVVWLRPFCRAHGLDPGNMQHVVSGERQHHKGWRLADSDPWRKPYAIERYLEEKA